MQWDVSVKLTRKKPDTSPGQLPGALQACFSSCPRSSQAAPQTVPGNWLLRLEPQESRRQGLRAKRPPQGLGDGWQCGCYGLQEVGQPEAQHNPDAGPRAPPRSSVKARCPLPARKWQSTGLAKDPRESWASGQGGGHSGPRSTQEFQERKACEEIALVSRLRMRRLPHWVRQWLMPKVDSSSWNSEPVSRLGLHRDVLSYSITDPYAEYKSFEESLSSYPSPELFRGSDYRLGVIQVGRTHATQEFCSSGYQESSSQREGTTVFKPLYHFRNLFRRLSEMHRKRVRTLADQNISPKPKSTSN